MQNIFPVIKDLFRYIPRICTFVLVVLCDELFYRHFLLQAVELYKDYEPGHLEASAKMLVLFCMLEEIVLVGDRLLLFSQSLFTLDLIEQFLHLHTIPNTDEKWMRNRNYFRK